MPLCCFARGTPLGVYGFFGGPDGGWDFRTWAVVRRGRTFFCFLKNLSEVRMLTTFLFR